MYQKHNINKHMKSGQRTFLTASIALLLFPLSMSAADGTAGAPSPWMTAPFILLLISIAVMPFAARHWWEKYYPLVSISLGAVTVAYYLFMLDNPIRMLHSGIEFMSFICLVGSLFIVSGGLLIRLKGYSTPTSNLLILIFGAVISNIVGTTGAAMILIRPWLRNNKYRLHPYHIVFFIFIVCNIGGSLTPIGDPPLFLGYLKGVPFFWVMLHLWPMWLMATVIILAIFFVIDSYFYGKVPIHVREEKQRSGESIRVDGLHNLAFLLLVLISVFIQDPPFLRESLMILAAVGSYYTTKRRIHEANDFDFHPIREVGFIFIGLFATMVPALDWLELNAASLGITSPTDFYWGTGFLSAFLDNAPTYLNFLSAAVGLHAPSELVLTIQKIIADAAYGDLSRHSPQVQQTFAALFKYHGDLVASGEVPVSDIQISCLLGMHDIYIKAISVSAVFFGAMTYIGNAPNFMVKSIAEQSGVRMPSFTGFIIRFSIPVLMPVFIMIWLLFFR